MALFGYEFRKRDQTQTRLNVVIRGVSQTIEVLQWFPFTSDKKRTSIVIRKNGELWLLCKV